MYLLSTLRRNNFSFFAERIEDNEMISTLNEINSQGIFTIILCVVLVLLLIVEGTKLWKGTLESLDLKSGKELRENALNERMDALESELKNVKTTFLDNQETYHGQSIEIRNNLQENQENLSKQMTELKQLFINKEIDDMRWEMLDFASAIMNHRRCSKEQYDHVIDTYVKYEQILEENHMENGRVTSSMEFVNDKYKKLMSVGFDHDKLNE